MSSALKTLLWTLVQATFTKVLVGHLESLDNFDNVF